MKLTKEQIEKLANLARLELTEEEKERFAGQLTSILNYVDVLRELDTTGVPETSQVTGLSNVTRKDEVRPGVASPDELLEASPLPKMKHQIRVKRVI